MVGWPRALRQQRTVGDTDGWPAEVGAYVESEARAAGVVTARRVDHEDVEWFAEAFHNCHVEPAFPQGQKARLIRATGPAGHRRSLHAATRFEDCRSSPSLVACRSRSAATPAETHEHSGDPEPIIRVAERERVFCGEPPLGLFEFVHRSYEIHQLRLWRASLP